MKRIVIVSLLCGATALYAGEPENFHRVAEGVYRSGQPSRREFIELEQEGFKSVLNLREHHSDRNALRQLDIVEYRLKLDAGKLTEKDLARALEILRDAERPILIHCWHGSDRTGAVVAAYRIVFENWTVEDAVAELETPEYGHHKRIYKNIPALLRKIDWDALRERLEIEAEPEAAAEEAA